MPIQIYKKKVILKKISNEGYKTKIYLFMVTDHESEMVFVIRKIGFTNDPSVGIILKNVNEKIFLFEHHISFKVNTFKAVISAFNDFCNDLISHFEVIECPECKHVQEAMVVHNFPFYSYIHECENCGFIIMESDWKRISK